MVTIYWYDDTHRILIYEFDHGWQTEDYLAQSAKATDMMDSADGPVDVINLMHNASAPSSIITAFPRMIRTAPFAHPNMGRMVMVEAEGFTDVAASLFSSIYMKLHMAASLEQAIALLTELDAKV